MTATTATTTTSDRDHHAVSENGPGRAAATRRRLPLAPTAPAGNYADSDNSVWVYSDTHVGRHPPDVELAEARMTEVEREVGRLPERDKRSALKALCRHPTLFVSSAHAMLFLRQSDDFDPKVAARRLALYWERREAMFGERAFDPEVFKCPTRDDYLRYYERSRAVASDPDADDTMRHIAVEFVKNVHAAKIATMDRVLEKEITPDDRAAWAEAASSMPDGGAASDEHKVMFLQNNDFYEQRAASQMVKYWQTRRDMFGPEVSAYGRSMTLDDLNERGYGREMRAGVMRVMPGLDESGRCVVVALMDRLQEEEGLTLEGHLAALWYVWHAALESPACRDKGVVLIINYRGMMSPDLMRKIKPYRSAARRIVFGVLPVKVRALHVQFGPDGGMGRWKRLFLAPSVAFASLLLKMRAVMYFGSDGEFVEELGKCGVPAEQVPVELGGTVTSDDWDDWLQERRRLGL